MFCWFYGPSGLMHTFPSKSTHLTLSRCFRMAFHLSPACHSASTVVRGPYLELIGSPQTVPVAWQLCLQHRPRLGPSLASHQLLCLETAGVPSSALLLPPPSNPQSLLLGGSLATYLVPPHSAKTLDTLEQKQGLCQPCKLLSDCHLLVTNLVSLFLPSARHAPA